MKSHRNLQAQLKTAQDGSRFFDQATDNDEVLMDQLDS